MLRAILLFILLSSLPLLANDPGGGSATGGANVTLTDNGSTVTLANGEISAVVTKSNAKINSLVYNGIQCVRSGGDIYFSMDGGTNYRQPSGCTYSVTANTTDMVDIAMRQTWSTEAQPFDIEVHYVLRRGDTGIYAYALLDHPATYPAGGLSEWRMVWKLPDDTFERLFVDFHDSERNRQMPSSADYAAATSTGIAEILQLTTGVLVGQKEGKYCYNARYSESPAYGHASNANNTGVFLVFGSQEFFNDGPFKTDLAPAYQILHVHFGRNHYDGSPTEVAAGEAWRKLYGPYLLYCNTDPAGANACWADAKAQAAAEAAAWPYPWLTGNADFPTAAQRGTVSGSISISDPLKPSLTAEGALVGLAQTNGGDFQYESKGYQHWAKAGANGSFTIPNVRPGTYSLFCVADGVAGQYEHPATITVGTGGVVNLSPITWNISRTGTLLAWEIGLPDRQATEFANGKEAWKPYMWDEFVAEFSSTLSYDVSSSIASTDWNYCHSAYGDSLAATGGTWPFQVHFNLPSVPPAGTARLHLAFTGSHYARMHIVVNGDSSPGFFYPANSRGNGLLRQSNNAKYAYHTIDIPVSLLQAGANTIQITQGKVDTSGANAMYDYLALELPTLPAGNPSDADGDGLTDAWELLHFKTLSYTASEDPDGDTYTNATEETYNSDPTDPASIPNPDSDGDLINDFWELTYYPTPATASPLDDTDGDGFDTWTEWKAGTDPTDPASYPGGTSAFTASLVAVADAPVFHRDGSYGYNSSNYGSAEQLDTSQFGSGIWAMSYIRFDLSAIPAGATIGSASLHLMRQATTNIAGYPVNRSDTITTGRFGSYGLLDVSGNTSQTWDEATITGDSLGAELASGANPQIDSATRAIDFNTDTETIIGGNIYTAGGSTVDVSGPGITSFVQGRLDATANTGLATIIIDFMEDSPTAGRGFSFASRENTTSLDPPTLTVNYTSGIPVPNTDEDNDGLHDGWEAQYFATLDHIASDDTDSDGTPEWLEQALSTDPTNPNEKLTLTIAPSGPATAQLTWPNGPGLVFTLQSSTTLTAPWTTEATYNGTSSPATLTHPTPTNEPRRFYRLNVEKP